MSPTKHCPTPKARTSLLLLILIPGTQVELPLLSDVSHFRYDCELGAYTQISKALKFNVYKQTFTSASLPISSIPAFSSLTSPPPRPPPPKKPNKQKQTLPIINLLCLGINGTTLLHSTAQARNLGSNTDFSF